VLIGLGFVEIILLHKSILRGFFLANHLASTDNLTRTNKRQNTYKRKLTLTQKVAVISNKLYTRKTYADRKDGHIPGLVTF